MRKEIQALLIAIPLLSETALSWDELQSQLLNSCPDSQHSIREGMAALEVYYPFVRNLQDTSAVGSPTSVRNL